MIEPLPGYFLYVNNEQLPDFFRTLEEAEESAKEYLQERKPLRITSTMDLIRTWNYRDDLKQWVEFVRG